MSEPASDKRDGKLVTGSTINPICELKLRWADPQYGPTFVWHIPIAGIRWRLHTADNKFEWSREPIEMVGQDTSAQQARLELQVPHGVEVLNPPIHLVKPDQVGPTSDSYIFDLRKLGDVLTLKIGGRLTDLVFLSTRPHLEDLQVSVSNSELKIDWKGRITPEMNLLAWRLDRPWERPQQTPVKAMTGVGSAILHVDPNQPWLITLGRQKKGGFGGTWEIAWDLDRTEYDVVYAPRVPERIALIWRRLTREQRKKQPNWEFSPRDANAIADQTSLKLFDDWLMALPDGAMRQTIERWRLQVGPPLPPPPPLPPDDGPKWIRAVTDMRLDPDSITSSDDVERYKESGFASPWSELIQAEAWYRYGSHSSDVTAGCWESCIGLVKTALNCTVARGSEEQRTAIILRSLSQFYLGKAVDADAINSSGWRDVEKRLILAIAASIRFLTQPWRSFLSRSKDDLKISDFPSEVCPGERRLFRFIVNLAFKRAECAEDWSEIQNLADGRFLALPLLKARFCRFSGLTKDSDRYYQHAYDAYVSAGADVEPILGEMGEMQ